MNNIPDIIEVALLLLVAFTLGCMIGYGLYRLIRGKPAENRTVRAEVAPAPTPVVTEVASLAPVKKTAPRKQTVAPSASSTTDQPEALAAPRAGGKDNLKLIKGIGPKIETMLNERGIYHYDQIAGWNKKSIDWINASLSFKGRVEREQWVSQAKALAKKAK